MAFDGGRAASPGARASRRRPRDAMVAGEAGAVIWRTGQVFAEPSDARHAAATAHPHRDTPSGRLHVGRPCTDPVLDGARGVTQARVRGRSLSA